MCVIDRYAISDGTPSPMQNPERVSMDIFRENSEDIYAGIEFDANTKDADQLIKHFVRIMVLTTYVSLSHVVLASRLSQRLVVSV